MWNKISKSSGRSWNKTIEPVQKYHQFSLLQENGYKLLQEDKSQLSTQDQDILIQIWDKISKSAGRAWGKFQKPSYVPIYRSFNLLQEDGYKLLQEDGHSLIRIEELQQLWRELTKHKGTNWNKIK